MVKRAIWGLLMASMVAVCSLKEPLQAQDRERDLAGLSVEELLQLEEMSAAKKEQIAYLGGMINLIVEDNRVQFVVNFGAVERATKN